MKRLTDSEALDQLAEFMARPGQWIGGDVCEVAAEVIEATGRPSPGMGEDAICSHCGHDLDDTEPHPDFVKALAAFHAQRKAEETA